MSIQNVFTKNINRDHADSAIRHGGDLGGAAGDYSVNVWAPVSHMRAAFTVK